MVEGNAEDPWLLRPSDPELAMTKQRANRLGFAIHAARLLCPDAAALGSRQPVWALRPRYEHPSRPAVIEMEAGDTTVGSTPYWCFCDGCYRPIADIAQTFVTRRSGLLCPLLENLQ